MILAGQRKSVAFIVVNYNGRKIIRENLLSIFRQRTNFHIRIILVDNRSDDGSVKYVAGEFPQVDIIRLKKNEGFARANNIGIKKALSNKFVDFIGLVNNDVTLEKNWLKWALLTLQKRPKAGCVSGKVLFRQSNKIDSVGVTLISNFRFVKKGYGESDLGQYETEEEILASNFAAVLCRRRMLEDINFKGEFLDNDFFAYFEDVDLCLRAKMEGWQCWYQPKSICYHVGSYTSSRLGSNFIIYHSLRNRLWLVVKIFPLSILLKALFRQLLPVKDSAYSREIKRLAFFTRVLIFTYATLSVFAKIPKMLMKRYRIYNNLSQERVKAWEKELISQLY